MFRFVVLALTLSYVYGGGYGGGAPLALGGYGGGAPLALGPIAGGLAGSLNYGRGQSFNHGPITAAIQSTRTYEIVPVALNYDAPVPQTIDVGPNIQPVNIIFRTQSSPLNVEQVHSPGAPYHDSTQSEDAPSVLTHTNYKPVIQEFREVIQPYRKIEQRVQPVIENVHTVVAQGEEYRAPLALAAPAPFAANNYNRAPLSLLSNGNGY